MAIFFRENWKLPPVVYFKMFQDVDYFFSGSRGGGGSVGFVRARIGPNFFAFLAADAVVLVGGRSSSGVREMAERGAVVQSVGDSSL